MSMNEDEESIELYKEFGDQIEEFEKSLERMKKAYKELDLALMQSSFYEIKKRVQYVDLEYYEDGGDDSVGKLGSN